MFRPKTLFVVGAGASAEIELPLGRKLVSTIANALNIRIEFGRLKSGNGDFYHLLRNHFGDRGGLDEHRLACRALANGLRYATSIDQYLDTRTDDEEIRLCGKAAIVYFLLEAEKESELKDAPPRGAPDLDSSVLNESWYRAFAEMLFLGVRRTDIETLFDGISIICFNYDRCIERFLPYAVMTHFGIDLAEAQSVVGRLKILHPYGTLGPLQDPQYPNGLPFGADPRRVNVFERSSRIKTFTEQVEDEVVLAEIRAEMTQAETIVFMGFGFHPDNMRLLQPSARTSFPRVFATAHGESETGRTEIHTKLYELLTGHRRRFDQILTRDHFSIVDLKCKELLGEFSRSLLA